MINKQVRIFFPSPHLAYSPTTINLYLELKKVFFDVKIIAPYPTRFNNRELPNFNVSYFNEQPVEVFTKIKALFMFLLYKLIGFKQGGTYLYSYSFFKAIEKYTQVFKKESSANNGQLVIAVDILFLKLATKYYSKVHFLSLEIEDELLPLLKSIPDNKIESVIIQSEERYKYIFGTKNINRYIIQNSPPFVPSKFRDKNRIDKLIFSGTSAKIFGILDFIEFLAYYKGIYTGIIKGNILDDMRAVIENKYKSLIETKVLTIDETYTDNSEIVNYISQFEIGICFYHLDYIEMNKFNYYSAPSGKMFSYLAAGVPVIGSDIPGLKIIEEYKCGVLIKDTSPQQIKAAVEKIRNNYQNYSSNCALAAQEFSFDTMAKPFLNYLVNS